jgi:hypothetical protein
MTSKSCVGDEVLGSPYRGVFLVAGMIYSRRDSNAQHMRGSIEYDSECHHKTMQEKPSPEKH